MSAIARREGRAVYRAKGPGRMSGRILTRPAQADRLSERNRECARPCSIRCSLRCHPCRGSGRSWKGFTRGCLGRDAEPARIIDLLAPPAERLRRPAQSAEARRSDAGHRRHRCGHDRSAPAAAAASAARAVQYRGERRHQHADHHLFQRAQRLPARSNFRSAKSATSRAPHAL